uniref:Tubulin--tyrosine ligase-like protein 9 n=1 Tax=Ditylum brightwellii TaxID=49249 RepID=A0A7S1ZJ02_9STRA|mmetsp:Transcript_32922/g.49053  ORF Transcript_32922/g.49053 Transcript_32922/m.49053 type:complete len:514 (+) Transcript_32922:210-1751(+)
MRWFTTDELLVAPQQVDDKEKDGSKEEEEIVVPRTTYLPHGSDVNLMDVLKRCCDENSSVTLVGYGPTVQAICHILGDILCIPNVQVLRECIADESEARRDAMLEHGLLFDERVVSLTDFLEEYDCLHDRIDPGAVASADPAPKYVCDAKRGGHLCLFLPYLTRDYGYAEWPVQTWYQEGGSAAFTGKEGRTYYCPLGRRSVDLCDEPGFSSRFRLFLTGRQHLDEKDLLHQLVPELMPPTFHSVESARKYAAELMNAEDNAKLIWFVKAVNQNGGRAVKVTNELPGKIDTNEQIQLHVPRPLLFGESQVKFHVKSYQHISCDSDGNWNVYLYDMFYIATAPQPWSADDLSDEAQISSMRTHRLYVDDEFQKTWNIAKLVQSNIIKLMERAVQQGKLHRATTATADQTNDNKVKSSPLQFEIISADWMLDQDGKIYLIECNGTPVLYDPTSPKKQALTTPGLQLYDRLYQEDPENAVVNDTVIIREALRLALRGRVPPKSLWKHLVTIPARGH